MFLIFVLQFILQFTHLHTAQFSNLSFENIIDSKITLKNETCFPSLRKLSLNYDCSPINPKITHINPTIFKKFCNLSLLDLSCLGLKKVFPGLLKLNSRANFKSSVNSDKLTVDLSRNQLTNISEGIADLRTIQNNYSQINLNLNYNAFNVIPELDITHFTETSNNHLEIWQDSETTKLNCSSCDNAWLINQNFIKSFCNLKESHQLILVEQLTKANFKHCFN